MKKEFENTFKKIKHEDKDFSSHKLDWENFEQNNESIAINVSFSSKDNDQSEYNLERENKVPLLMINDDDEKYSYFTV